MKIPHKNHGLSIIGNKECWNYKATVTENQQEVGGTTGRREGQRGEGSDRGWNDWMASPTQWTWVWASSESWWWTGTPGVLQSMGLQRVGQDLVTEQQQLKQILVQSVHISTHHNSQKDESNSNVHQLCWEHTVEYYSTIKRKELWQHGTTWMNSVNFMLTERSQTQKITYGSTYMKYSEQADAWKLNIDWRLLEAGVLG